MLSNIHRRQNANAVWSTCAYRHGTSSVVGPDGIAFTTPKGLITLRQSRCELCRKDSSGFIDLISGGVNEVIKSWT